MFLPDFVSTSRKWIRRKKGIDMAEKYTYEQVIDKIQSAKRFGNYPGAVVTKVMLDCLGNPQEGLPFIHVAGTNGKGSTCAFLSSIFQKAGKKVGTFTSPHLIDFRERITVNGEMISKESVERIGNQLLATNFMLPATMFDYCTVMALVYFKEQGCDLAIIETGLGGRLDSTNAIGVPEAAVITKIGYDHTEILGEKLYEIASEKAGILKAGTHFAVSQMQEKDAEAVIQSFAKEIYFKKVTTEEMDKYKGLSLKMKGAYQLENATTAAMVAKELLYREGMAEAQIQKFVAEGLESATWMGRMQLVSEIPFLMVDGAHNSNGVHALVESLKNLYPEEKFHFVMGVMADKDYEKMIEEVYPIALDFKTVAPASERSLKAEELAQVIRQQGMQAESCDSIDAVLETLPTTKGKTIAFGSLYFIGDLLSKVVI